MGKKSGSWQFPAHYRKARNCQESLFGIFWKLLAKFWKWHKFLAISSSLYIGKKLPGTTCILKVQPLPGNFYPIYRELGIDRMWLHFMELTGTTFMVKVDPVDSQPIHNMTWHKKWNLGKILKKKIIIFFLYFFTVKSGNKKRVKAILGKNSFFSTAYMALGF